ncbi:hypothetical protein [Halobaculum sp. EA56]|uniref:hypothetical protein n=1 Tax=Halobaculum sp. EA56 TaxID=3421648 RepID=UPI003EBC71C4
MIPDTSPLRRDAGPPPAALLALASGYLALAAGVFVARLHPPNGYEPSIYAATPAVYWVCAVAALIVGFVAAATWGRFGRYAGIGLAGLTVVSFVGLPLIRGYYFYGGGDALTHLGYARAVSGGSAEFFNHIYPGGYGLSVFLARAMDVPVRHGMMYATLAVTAVTLLFLPLCVWTVLRDPRAAVLGAFTAMLLMPINNVSTTISFHTYTVATLYFPFALYLAFKHIARGGEDESLPGWLSPANLIAPVALFSLVIFHPQVAVDTAILFTTFLLAGVVMRRLRTRKETAHGVDVAADGGRGPSRLLIGQTLVLAAVLVLWVSGFEKTYIFAENLVNSLETFTETGEGAGAVAQDRSESAERAGISLLELFAKLFSVNLLYVLACGGLILAKVRSLFDGPASDADRAITYIALSALTLGPFFLAQFVGDVSGYFFRHLGFAMVLIGVVGSLALYRAADGIGPVGDGARTAVAVVGVLVVCVSLAAFFPSPYIYLPSDHTPEEEFAGFESGFAFLPDETSMAKPRPGPGRMMDATNSDPDGVRLWQISGAQMSSLERVINATPEGGSADGYYLVLSERDREREVVGFHGIRFQAEDFERIHDARDPRITLVLSNGDFRIYYVDQRDAGPAGADARVGSPESPSIAGADGVASTPDGAARSARSVRPAGAV